MPKSVIQIATFTVIFFFLPNLRIRGPDVFVLYHSKLCPLLTIHKPQCYT